MHVVSDTSPLCYLSLINLLDVLPVIFDKVTIPSAVHQELLLGGSPVKEWLANPPAWLEIVSPADVNANFNLDLGETAAIALSLELQPDNLLIDERKGRFVAGKLGIQVYGTLGVIAIAAEQKLLDGNAAIDQLLQTNFFADRKLIAKMRRQFKEIE